MAQWRIGQERLNVGSRVRCSATPWLRTKPHGPRTMMVIGSIESIMPPFGRTLRAGLQKRDRYHRPAHRLGAGEVGRNSPLRLPPDSAEAQAAQRHAEVLRRQLLKREALRRAAYWLDGRVGREVFGRGVPKSDLKDEFYRPYALERSIRLQPIRKPQADVHVP